MAAKWVRRLLAAGLVSALALATIFAQEKQNPDSTAFRKSGVGVERSRLSFLVGNYVTETHVLPGSMVKEKAVGKGTSLISWGLDSMFLFIDERSHNPLMGNYKGFGVLGYDPRERQYVLSMYNNFGDTPQYRGGFSGDTIVLSSTVQMPGRTLVQKLQWYMEGTAVRLRVLTDAGQGFVPVVEQWARPVSGTAK